MSTVRLAQGPDQGMVWHHGSPLAEGRKMAAGRGRLALSSRQILQITGDYALWLHDLTSQDFTSAQAPTSGDGLVLDASGHILHGFFFIRQGQQLWAVTEPGARDALVDWLMAVRFWTPVEITARDDLGVVWRGQDEPAEHQVAGTPSGIGGWIDIVPREWAETVDAPPAGQWGYEALRIEAGIPRIGIDTDTRTIPNEIGLFGTALDKGCYPGQETVARVYNLGHPPRRLVRLLFDGSAPEPGAAIVVDGREVGRLTSSAQHFDLGPVGLGMIKRNIPTDALLKVAGVGASQEIIVDPEVGEHFRPSIGGQAHGSLL